MKEHIKQLHDELRRDWPLDALKLEAARTNQTLGKTGDEAFDPTLPPVFFVGNLEEFRFVLVGVNPGRGTEGNPSWDAERELISADFDTYWRSRPAYFGGPSYNRNHYDPTGILIAALDETELSPREQIGKFMSPD